MLTPPLTTIKTEGVRQGTIAAQMLFARLNHRPLENNRVRLEPELVVRRSTRPHPHRTFRKKSAAALEANGSTRHPKGLDAPPAMLSTGRLEG